ncbi:MAG TPA: hypothetical protein DCY13_01050 [Verrucomicrobiales bacterium]|nr:hypothetical protein [Verrucomicrobiales bacterium]
MPVPALTSTLRVRSCDVDSFGHVNNAVYLQYCEGARNDYMLERGLTFADFERWQAGPVLTRAQLEFKFPARTDDQLAIRGNISLIGRTRFRIQHEVVRIPDGTHVCGADLHFAFVDLTSGRPVRVPAKFLAAFEL